MPPRAATTLPIIITLSNQFSFLSDSSRPHPIIKIRPNRHIPKPTSVIGSSMINIYCNENRKVYTTTIFMVFFYCPLILISMRKNTKKINDEYYHKKGYKNEDLNIRGKPRRGLASFQCEEKLWKEFDEIVEEKHGKYKKSYIIEGLIREYMALKKSKLLDQNENDDYYR